MTMHTTPISVRIAHPESVVALGLRALLSDQAQFRVLPDAAEAPAAPADVLVTDYTRGVSMARERRHGNGPAILVLSQLDREWEVRSALESGVDGYLLQSGPADDIVRAVRTLGMRERFVSSALLGLVARSLARDKLTRRETDVLQLLAEGYCNKRIARQLGIGVGTVKTHVQSMMGKLDVHGRTHAVAVAARRGLVMMGQ
jgi:DNA-binding NarL/FixJ family response regulator